jgi:hypothetical protein
MLPGTVSSLLVPSSRWEVGWRWKGKVKAQAEAKLRGSTFFSSFYFFSVPLQLGRKISVN